jgi:hypothetical protein
MNTTETATVHVTPEAKDDGLCHGVPGRSVWYCKECDRMLNSPETPHQKPMPILAKETPALIGPNRATRRLRNRKKAVRREVSA